MNFLFTATLFVDLYQVYRKYGGQHYLFLLFLLIWPMANSAGEIWTIVAVQWDICSVAGKFVKGICQ